MTRIVTNDFPVYFALVTRIRQETKLIGMEGGLISSTVVPQVQAMFPEGAIQKSIRVGVQVRTISKLFICVPNKCMSFFNKNYVQQVRFSHLFTYLQ